MGNRKNHFEISAFSAKWTRSRKIQCAFFCVYVFIWVSRSWMKFLVRNSKKWQFKKEKKSVSYPIIYIGLIQARQYLKPIHNICYKSWFYIFRIFVIIIYIIVIDDTLIWWPFLPFFLSVQCPLFHLFVGLGLYLLWCFIVILPRQKWLSNLMEPWKMDWFLVCTLTTPYCIVN